MSTKKKSATDPVSLRKNAEESLAARLPSEINLDSRHMVHELQVHQIELEMQNQELLETQGVLELSLKKIAALYEFAPVGHFTFGPKGEIRGVNVAGAQLLGLDKDALINKSFDHFIADASDIEVFNNHLELILRRHGMLRCEIRLSRNDGTVFQGQLQSVILTSLESNEVDILTSIVDGTIRKQLEDKLQTAHDCLELLVSERTRELSISNIQLKHEVEERKKSEDSLRAAYLEIKSLQNRLQAENIYLKQEVAEIYSFGEVIGQSTPLAEVFSQVDQVASMNATVLLLGETGTGKGIMARAIHNRSSRKNQPMITVNCTALPGNLFESELFGREKGAFTGAYVRQMGRFELANGGTIFLDEIGEMPLELQCKLLRVVQDGEFERLGSPVTIKVDVRIIAASNRNLEEEVKNGRFREDLFYRLNIFPIVIPPLRQRKEDIPLLVNHFVAKFNKKIGRQIETIPKSTMLALQEYQWPGNVRELESIIERAIIISKGSTLQVLDRLDTFRKTDESAGADIKELGDLEQEHILQALQKTGWRVEGKKGAAVLLGINPSTLRARIRKHGIRRQ